MKKDFYNLDHAISYLSGTIIRYKEKPVYIREVYQDDEIRINVSPVVGARMISAKLSSKDVDINPFPLGFVNTVRNASMRGHDFQTEVDVTTSLSRTPARRWKVGLDSRSLWKWTIEANSPLSVDFPRIRSVLYSKGFEDMRS